MRPFIEGQVHKADKTAAIDYAASGMRPAGEPLKPTFSRSKAQWLMRLLLQHE
ncbi:MAG: hypothetical protein ACJAY7_000985 [Pseudohongiellaceae bacterium]|jgi:hypothetical protein